MGRTVGKTPPIVTTAPLLCIEIPSPEDRLKRTITRCNDIFHLGVPEAWIFDPDARTVMVLRPNGIMTTHTSGTLTLDNTPTAVNLPATFAILDEEESPNTTA